MTVRVPCHESARIMTANATDATGERLILQSGIPQLSRIPPWIEHLAAKHSIPENTQFAIDLCLEEVLSNVMRYGYSGELDRPIVVLFTNPRDNFFVFVIEDEAPPFNPLEAPELPVLRSLDELRVGGNGIRLLREFAQSLEYQATPTGNRLIIGFSAAD
jgi:anti-sigma regulatory factor (Ser/Thr protein kinase)